MEVPVWPTQTKYTTSHGCLSHNSKLPELAEIVQFRDESFNNGSMQPSLTNSQTSVLQEVLMYFN